ncbi:MAG TPA: orotate phosphoribosyltransferase [Xanthobacteraceae bacterium]|nr:orotate phosphoribosyltransferase [Xanthobacteraceae bacterium]
MSAEIGKTVAQLLLDARAIHVSRTQPYILAAGWASPVYVDCRVLIGEPEHRRAIIELAFQHARAAFPPASFDAIAGAETAGIPFACWLADRMNVKLRYVRKRALGVGRHAQIEGGSVDGLRVLLVDDLTSDGSSKLAFTRGLRAANAVVEHALTIFYHNAFPGAATRLAHAGLLLHSLATWADVLRADAANGLATEDRTEIERFLADPIAWSTNHGGRSAA